MIRATRFAFLAVATLLGLLICSILASPVRGETVRCNLLPMSTIAGGLATKYDELAVNLGVLAGGSGLISIFASHAGTFTIVLTTPENEGCIIMVGNSWQTMALPPEGDLN